jgi:prolyl oligopeptidase
MRLATPVVLALAAACATPTPPAAVGGTPNGTQPMIEELNAEARRGAVVEQVAGLRIEDPYRALEEDSPLTRRWMQAQTARTEQALGPWTTDRTRRRLRALFAIGTLGSPAMGGDRLFHTRRMGDREQAALFMVEGGTPRADPLVDPLDHGERASLDWFYPSPDGRLVAFGISQRGDERSTLRILDVDGGHTLPDTIERTKWTRLEWLPDSSGFYYTRYPAPGEPGHDPDQPESYFPRVFFHRLGGDVADDPRVHGSDRGTDFPGVSISDDGRWMVLNVFRGWSRSDVYLFDRGADPEARRVAPDAAHPLVPVAVGRDALTFGRVHRGRLYLFTNEGAPRWRLAAVALEHAGDRERWHDVVPEPAQGTLDAWAMAGDRLVVHAIDDVRSRLLRYDLSGQPLGEVPLPARGSASGLTDAPQGERFAFIFSSYLHAPTLFVQDGDAPAPSEVVRVEHDLDLGRYELRMAHVRSADGTRVPVQLVHARGLEPTGDHPVLLTGYGGFNLSLLPSFSRHALHWIERGGVYAVANLRGGSEHGQAWHRAGSLENKPRVFEDFEAVLRWLVTSGISRPERIAITGRSNGGLLMGAAITRAPQAFAAAATYVGLYDMVRYDRFPPAELWISEYGDPNDPEALRTLHGYSPYHRVRDGVRYPAVLVEAADHDSRVHWAHSTKLAARLQEATASDAPVYFYLQRQLGHGAGTRLSDLVDEYARMYGFFDSVLGTHDGAARAPGPASAPPGRPPRP